MDMFGEDGRKLKRVFGAKAAEKCGRMHIKCQRQSRKPRVQISEIVHSPFFGSS